MAHGVPVHFATICFNISCRSDFKLSLNLAKVPRLDLTPVLAQAEEDQQFEAEQQQLDLEQESQLLAEEQQQQQLLLEFSDHQEEQLHRGRTRPDMHDGQWPQHAAGTAVVIVLAFHATAATIIACHVRWAAVSCLAFDLLSLLVKLSSLFVTCRSCPQRCTWRNLTLTVQASHSLPVLVLASMAHRQGGVPVAAAAASAAQRQSRLPSRSPFMSTNL